MSEEEKQPEKLEPIIEIKPKPATFGGLLAVNYSGEEQKPAEVEEE